MWTQGIGVGIGANTSIRSHYGSEQPAEREEPMRGGIALARCRSAASAPAAVVP